MIQPMVFGLGGWEILIIALVILLIFGGAKIPELMKGLGKGIKNFKEGIKEGDEENKDGEARQITDKKDEDK
jgi:sec-independent protein translocase protein TatA